MKFFDSFKLFLRETRFHLIREFWGKKFTLYSLLTLLHPILAAFTIIGFLVNKLFHPKYENLPINRRLTDEELLNDLPFHLAKNGIAQGVDLSNHDMGEKTLRLLTQYLHTTKLQELNLSNTPFDQATANLLPDLIPSFASHNALKTLKLLNCNLTLENIDKLIIQLKKNRSLIKLEVGDQATPEQTIKIKSLLKFNKFYNLLKTKYCKQNILDLQNIHVDLKNANCLITFIKEQRWIKEIKMPNLSIALTEEEYTPLVNAIKQNNLITSLTMDMRNLSKDNKEEIRKHLMLNKAQKKVHPTVNILQGFVMIALFHVAVPFINLGFVFVFFVCAKSLYNFYFTKGLEQAKSANYADPENAQAIERGKNATNSWLSYLNPKSYTPMAYLGYTIEKNHLRTKYGVKTPCFKPISPSH